jgi:hypothetical protein
MSNPLQKSSTAPADNLPICRGVYDLNTRWTRSPSIKTDLPPSEATDLKTPRSRSASCRHQAKLNIWIRLGHLLRRFWSNTRTGESADPRRSNRFSGRGPSLTCPAPSASDWRAYGYWACPRVNGVNVNNRCAYYSTAPVTLTLTIRSKPDDTSHGCGLRQHFPISCGT